MAQHEIAITPVGVVRSPQKELAWEAGSENDCWQARAARERAVTKAVARIEIDPAFDGILDGTEDFSHLLVLWWPDRDRPGRPDGVKVRPMGRQDLPEVGIFATRSPTRPNPILTTVVEVVARRGTTLEVTGLDAIDGTPVVDIKPLTPSDCPLGELRVPEWLARVERELAELDED
jgi:tRNA (adenine37-N6)-methyltransferase